MGNFVDENLEKLKQISQQESVENQYSEQLEVTVPFEQFFLTNITSNLLKTMSMEYDVLSQVLKIQTIKDNFQGTMNKITTYSMAQEAYETFCEKYLHLDCKKQFNDSSNVTFNGVPVRVFAIMPPYKDTPLVVMSTAKKPPEKIEQLSDSDEKKLSMVLSSNFLICGISGAGKTYLLNYLLNKYFPKNRRVGIIQEFLEIYPPNEFTDLMTVPPRVPGQTYNDLEFLTEQSNLMRYDTLLVGEIKSSEAWPFVVNLASGTNGGATVHGTSSQSALQRLRTLCLLARTNLSSEVIDGFIKDAIEYVVYVEDAQVKSIDKLLTVNHGKYALEPVC